MQLTHRHCKPVLPALIAAGLALTGSALTWPAFAQKPGAPPPDGFGHGALAARSTKKPSVKAKHKPAHAVSHVKHKSAQTASRKRPDSGKRKETRS